MGGAERKKLCNRNRQVGTMRVGGLETRKVKRAGAEWSWGFLGRDKLWECGDVGNCLASGHRGKVEAAG